MRIRNTAQVLTVQAIAGSHVVLLAMDMKPGDCDGHLGFAIHRTDHTENEAYWLEGIKTFAATDPGFPAGARYPTNKHPIQGFTWSDFTAKPGHRYTYRVQALRGKPAALKKFKQVEVEVNTEAEEEGDHDIFFNRGAAASQEFARRFKKTPSLERAPPDDPRWAWLSRGAMEAIIAFVARANSNKFALRVAAYEFRLEQFASTLKAAIDRGVDVKVLFDACDNPPDEHGKVFPRDANRETADAASIENIRRVERVTRSGVKNPPISHHKFIVLLKNGKPQAVLTGSTNFSLGGVYGQSNVVHVVENPRVANSYMNCWELISTNPDHGELRQRLSGLNTIPVEKPRRGTTCIFSPQANNDALTWYAKQATVAENALFMTFAFGMNDVFKEAYRSGHSALRYALMEDLLAPGVRKENKPAALQEMKTLRQMPENRFAVGNRIATNHFDRWIKEELTGLNRHVQFIHTKFMLVDPLSDDPIVITGSANFSAASTTKNDENMLIIRGNRRVADVYLGEYMRLWNHYAFREWLAAKGESIDEGFKHLDTENKWWRGYFGNTVRSRQRQYFSGAAG
ncbi:MAG: phospholipase D-like domain-containing protein [Pseudomonadota bacterium]|nr:phospholipase D-like domain-containing protein [Pseudomonadota bacterium]